MLKTNIVQYVTYNGGRDFLQISSLHFTAPNQRQSQVVNASNATDTPRHHHCPPIKSSAETRATIVLNIALRDYPMTQHPAKTAQLSPHISRDTHKWPPLIGSCSHDVTCHVIWPRHGTWHVIWCQNQCSILSTFNNYYLTWPDKSIQ